MTTEEQIRRWVSPAKWKLFQQRLDMWNKNPDMLLIWAGDSATDLVKTIMDDIQKRFPDHRGEIGVKESIPPETLMIYGPW